MEIEAAASTIRFTASKSPRAAALVIAGLLSLMGGAMADASLSREYPDINSCLVLFQSSVVD